MSAIAAIALKDLRLLVRNRLALFWTFGFPLVYALFFGLISSGGGKTGKLEAAWVDEDRSPGSAALRQRLAESAAVAVQDAAGLDAARGAVVKGQQTAYVRVPAGFGAAAEKFGGARPELEVGVDPARNIERGILEGVLQQSLFRGLADNIADPAKARTMLRGFRTDLPGDLDPARKALLDQMFKLGDEALAGIKPAADGGNSGVAAAFQPANLKFVAAQRDQSQEPASAFEIFFPSGILWGVMGCAAGFALALAQERVAGTLTRLRLAPIPWFAVLAGKALACFVASGAVVVVLLLVGKVGFGVRLGQNPLGLAWAAAATAACFTGMMMLLAGVFRSPQGVNGAGWGINTIMAMVGGGMIPLIAMPEWLRNFSVVSPVRWGIISLEGAIWRGYSAWEMFTTGGVLWAIGAAAFAAGVWLAGRTQAG